MKIGRIGRWITFGRKLYITSEISGLGLHKDILRLGGSTNYSVHGMNQCYSRVDDLNWILVGQVDVEP